MDTNSAASTQTDPMTAVAEAMDAAIEAARGGAAQARTTFADLAPAAGEALSRALYRTSYTIAYGLVLPVALISRAMPKDNALVQGLVDGAHAAIDAMTEMKSGTETDLAP